MNPKTEDPLKPLPAFASFFIAALVAFAVYRLTMLTGLGPGVHGAWSATMLGAGQPMDASLSPAFVVLMRFLGLFVPSAQVLFMSHFFTALGGALAAGFAALLLYRAFHIQGVWAPWILAAFGGLLLAVAKPVWAASLAVNPAPWGLALLLLGWYLSLPPFAQPSPSFRRNFAAQFTLVLGLGMHLGLLPLFLAIMVFHFRANHAPALGATAMIVVIGYLLAKPEMVFETGGLFSATPGMPENAGALGWFRLVLYQALTPAGLLLAIGGLTLTIKGSPGLVRTLLQGSRLRTALAAAALLLGLIAGLMIPSTAPMQAIWLSALLALAATWGLMLLFQWLPTGLAPVAWLLMPLLLWLHGPELKRGSEQIWRVHLRNTLNTVRYESVVLSTDEALLNIPYRTMNAATGMRPDITLLNPQRVADPRYASWLLERYRGRFGGAGALLDSLRRAPEHQRQSLAKDFIQKLVQQEMERATDRGGVLVTPGYRPGTGHPLIAEGLLMRVYDGENAFPFLFRNLDLSPIRLAPGSPLLRQRAVALYPMMFTARGDWMLNRGFLAEGSDYIRWALKIDPAYRPARLLAGEYSIRGEPKKLEPRKWR